MGTTGTISDELGSGLECFHAFLQDLTLNKDIADVPCDTLSTDFTVTPGHAYQLRVIAEITDLTQPQYTGVGRVRLANGVTMELPATADWHSGSAGGTGIPNPEETVIPTDPATPPAPTPSIPSTPDTTPAHAPFPAPAPPETPRRPTPVIMPRPPKPVPNFASTVRRTFQVDRVVPVTKAQAAVLARLDDDRRLTYREDKALWGHSIWQFVTIKVPRNATTAQLVTAINARTSKRIGDVTTTATLRTATVGRPYVIAWELGRKATPAAPWGAGRNVTQSFLARS